MNRIEDFQAFAAVVEKGSLTAAARHLGRSLQSVSRSLAALEREVGVELVRRTTRRSSPTDAGLALHRRLAAALAEIEAAKLETANRRAEATGLLRISGSNAFRHSISSRPCRRFCRRIQNWKSTLSCPTAMSISLAKASISLSASGNCRIPA
jgi:DNA-binding transcriptional LysR family regulator